MSKEDFSIEGLYRVQKEDLKRFAHVAVQAFLDDESSKFLFSSKLTYKALYDYYLVMYKAVFRKMYMFAESENIDGFIILSPIQNSELTFWDFVKEGGLKVILSQGLGLVFRSLAYEKNCISIRKKLTSADTWYIFQFGVCPEKQGMGLGSKLMKPVLQWLDSQKMACYLETQKRANIDIYNHFGFCLKSTDTLPKKDICQFAMLRN